jgi:hypothetical protein
MSNVQVGDQIMIDTEGMEQGSSACVGVAR